MGFEDLVALAENLYFVRGEGNGRFPASHGFLIKGKETVLIDAGIGEARMRQIDRETRIDILIITHSHPDHIRHWHLLRDRFLLLPRETPEVVTDLDLLGERFTGSPEKGHYWAKFVRDGFGLHPLRDPDGRYADREVLRFGDAELEAIRAPGHLVDHYCFFERTSGTLISTDVDLTSFGPWYGNPEADLEAFEHDVRKLMAMPYKRVCSSHKLPIEGDASKHFEAFLGAFARHRETILNLCDPPSTLDQIAASSPFYGDTLPDKKVQHIFERNMTLKNLSLLIRAGLVEESDGVYARTGK